MSIYTFSEAELRSRFIKNIGNRDDIDVYIEVPVFCRSVDLVIQEKENAEIFAIEFKLHDWKRAIQQAQSVGLCFDYLYIDVILTPNSNPDLVANNLKDLLPSKRYLDAFPKNKVSFYYEGFGPYFSLSK